MGLSRRRAMLAAGIGVPAAGAAAWAVARARAADDVAPEVSEVVEGDRRTITSNAVPDHPRGDFPNSHDPVPLRAQRLRFAVPAKPVAATEPTPLGMWHFGVAVNGVPFEPSGPFWNADGRSGWQFEVLSPAVAVALGLDVNHAHTQGRGLYHYHGMPTGLLWARRVRDPGRRMHLLGWAGDGFPIYGPEAPGDPADPESPLRRLRSSYRLRSGTRPDGPGGRFDGTFVEDWAYEPGFGDLDACNGRTGPTPEFPGGTYYYVLTDDFPSIPRLFRGTPDPSFRHGPPPGVSPPLPPSLRRYRATG